MASLAQALRVSFQSNDDDGTFHYHCKLDPSWSIRATPQGGYSLGVLIEACIQHQSDSSHMDPIYVSAHFLRATNASNGEVRVKLFKPGKTFTHLLAELVQKGTTRIMAHVLFGDLSPPQPGEVHRVLAPPSPYARHVPLYSHPSTVSAVLVKPIWSRKMQTRLSLDTTLLSQNDPNSAERTTSESVGGGGTKWGAWYELSHKDDRLTTSSMALFCDSFDAMPVLLPKSEPTSNKDGSGFISVAMTIEFKARIPSSGKHSARTVGLYCESRFLTDPDRRHNQQVEVWTAPSEIGQGEVVEGWRDHQYCIAIANQVTLAFPVEMIMQQGTKDTAKL